MRIRCLSFVVLAALCTSARAEAQFRASDPAPGEQFHVELGATLWTPTPTLQINTGNVAIGEIDFVEEFAIADKRFTTFNLTLKPGRKHKVRFESLPFRYDATATVSRTITFGGLTVPVSAEASTEVKWDVYTFAYEYDLVARDRGFFGVVAGLKYNRVQGSVSAPPFGTEATDQKAPVPAIGVIGRGYPHRLVSITGEFTGFNVPDSLSDTFDAKEYDFNIYGTVSLSRYLGVQGGYRRLTADYLVDEDTGHLEMKGPYFAGVLRF